MGVFRTEHFQLAQIAHQTVLLHGVALTREERIARQHQPHQVALGAAAGEYPGVAGLVTDLGAQPLDQFHFDQRGRRALIPGVHALVGGVDQHFGGLANHQARAVQVRHALRVVHRQAVFQKVLDGALDRRLVAQALRGEVELDALAQFGNAFALIHLGLLQPLHDGFTALRDRLAVSLGAVRRGSQNRV